MPTKYYAVKNGRKPGIYTTWTECKAQVDGYSGAEYKSFPKKSEAEAYLNPTPGTDKSNPRENVAVSDVGIHRTENVGNAFMRSACSPYHSARLYPCRQPPLSKGDVSEADGGIAPVPAAPSNRPYPCENVAVSDVGIHRTENVGNAFMRSAGLPCQREVSAKLTEGLPRTRHPAETPPARGIAPEAVFYVDGSYNVKTGEYSFGAVLLRDGTEQTFSHKYSDPDSAKMRNVAGEIAGALFAMRYAVKFGIKSIEIFYDYEGIEKWAMGKWKTNLEKTKEYAAQYKKMSEYVTVKFTKVKGHSGDKYNDMADKLAKSALGI